MKKFIILILIFSGLTFYNFDKHTIEDYQVTEISQKGDYFCWAASLEGIFKYYQEIYPQEEIIKEYSRSFFLGNIDSPIYGYKPSVSRYFNNEKPHKYNKDFVRDGLLPDKGYESKIINKNDIISYVHKDIPILVFYNNHASIIVGYIKVFDQLYIKIMDPRYSPSKQDLFSYHPIEHFKGAYDYDPYMGTKNLIMDVKFLAIYK